MRERKSVFLLILIMTIISLVVVGIATFLLYRTAFDEEKARLVVTAQSQARLMEAIARFNTVYNKDYLEGSEKATLRQIIDAHENYRGFGETGEFTLARRVGDEIIFLLSHRHSDLEFPEPVPFESEIGEPMWLALSEMSGTVIGLDYRGEKVLAAYEPVAELNLGIVAKIDLAEIQAPFVRAGLIALGISLLAVILGASLFFRITTPMIKHLAESEEQFRSLVEASPDGITLTDLDGKILMCNPQTVKLHGFESMEEIIGKSSLEFMTPEHQQKAKNNMEKTLQDGMLKNVEYALLKKDGTHFPGELSASLMVDKEGKPTAFMAVTRDITEQKQAEEALYEKEQWLHTTLMSIGDAVIATDAKGIVNFMNHVAEDLTGWDKAKAVGKPLKDVFNIINEQTGESAENPVARVIREGIVVGLANHTVLIAKDGTKRPITDSGAPLRDEEGNIIGIVLVFRDIIEQKQAEETLRKSEERYRLLVKSVPSVLWKTNEKGITVFISSNIKEVYGYAPEEIYADGYNSWLGRIHHDDLQKVEKSFQALFGKGKKFDVEYRIKRKGGEWIWAHDVASVVHEENGERYAYGVFTDITERMQAKEEKERLQAQLVQSEKMAGIGTLTSGIAHEFNNMLQIMRGHTEYAQRTKKPEDMEEALDIMGNTSDRVVKIVKDLLTFSRKETQEKELCHISEPIASVLSLIEEQLMKHNITVVRKYEKTSKIEINKGEMHQVFLNIVLNARDAMLPKGGKLEIGIKKVKDNVEISFTDTGIGIEKENLSKIFEPFYTTKGAVGGDTKTQGVGLGLSVSYGIVERHSGTIEAESEVGRGTTFTIRLPVKVEKSKTRIVSEKREVKAKKIKPMNVLVVDDEEKIGEMFTKWLSPEGHKVKSALNGEKALQLVKKEHFDVVFLDVIMPGIPSLIVLEEIKSLSPKTKVIMITGRMLDKEFRKEYKQKGATQHLQKPFTIEDIDECLAGLGD